MYNVVISSVAFMRFTVYFYCSVLLMIYILSEWYRLVQNYLTLLAIDLRTF